MPIPISRIPPEYVAYLPPSAMLQAVVALQAPPHVNSLLWRLSSAQERVQLLRAEISAPAAPQPCSAPADTDRPAAIETGTKEYYRQRAEDFRRRNPCTEPPAYYMEYGDKYLHRFGELGSSDLSPLGLQWRDATTRALQEKMEAKRRSDPEGFAELERDPDAFRDFAYGTHPDAYVESGLFRLPVQDIAVIATTPDIGDVLNYEGIRQTLVTLDKLEGSDIGRIGGATVGKASYDIYNGAETVLDRIGVPHQMPRLGNNVELALEVVGGAAGEAISNAPLLSVPGAPSFADVYDGAKNWIG